VSTVEFTDLEHRLLNFTTDLIQSGRGGWGELLEALGGGRQIRLSPVTTIYSMDIVNRIDADTRDFIYKVAVANGDSGKVEYHRVVVPVTRRLERAIRDRDADQYDCQPDPHVQCSRCKKIGMSHYRTGKKTKRILCTPCFKHLESIGAAKEGGELDERQEIREDNKREERVPYR
jgi:hypothetical protein